MKKNVFLLFLMIIIASCSHSNKYAKYFQYKWGNGNRVILENGYMHSYTHYNSKLKKMVGDSLIPIKINDSTLIITQVVAKGKWENINEKFKFVPLSSTVVTDTFLFDFKKFHGIKLLLYKKDYRPIVYKLLENRTIKETHHLVDVKFKIAGYSIGDTINRNLLKIEDVSNFDSYSIEEGKLKSNENVEFDLIGGRYIFKITQHEISDYNIDDIIKVINTKLGIAPKHTPLIKGKEYEKEYYTWDKNGVSITLQKMKYIGNNTLKKLYSPEGWTLYYEDKIMDSLLKNEFKNSTPKSTVIN